MQASTLLLWLFLRSALLPHEPASLIVPNSPLPSSRSAYGWLETTAPQMISSEFDAGGLLAGRTAKIGVHGTSAVDTTFRFSGLDMTSTLRPGTPILLPDMAGTGVLSVTRMGSDITRNAPGPVVEWAPVDGSQRVGMIEGFVMPSKFAIAPSATGAQPVSQLQSFADASVLLAGALRPGKSSAALSAHWARSESIDRSAHAGRLAQDANPTTFRRDDLSIAAHLGFTPTPNGRGGIDVAYQRAQVSAPSKFIDLNVSPEVQDGPRVGADPDTRGAAQVSWQGGSPDAWQMVGAAGYQWMQVGHRASDASLSFIETDSAFDGAVFPRLFDADGSERALRANLGLRKRGSVAGLTHYLQFGGAADRTSIKPQLANLNIVREFVNGVPARVWVVDAPPTSPRWTSNTSSAFVSDRVGSETIWFEAGVRVDRLAADNSGATKIAWTNVFGHAAAEVFDTRSGFGVFGSYTRSGARLPPMALAWGDPNAPTAVVSRWPGGPLSDSNLTPIMRVGPGAANGLTKIASDLVRPTYDTAIGGVKYDRARFAMGISAVIRTTKHSIRAVADSLSNYSIVTQPDKNADFTDASDDQQLSAYNRTPGTFGLDSYTLMNLDSVGANAIYAFDFTAQYRGRRARIAFSAAAVAAKGTAASRGFRADENDPMLIGEAFAYPNATVNAADGRTFFDRGYIGKIVGAFDLPARISLGVVARYEDGQPFSRLAIFEHLNQGPEAVVAYRNGRPTRFTYISTTDVRVQRVTAFGSKQLTLIVDAFNVFNIGREVGEYVIGDASFRTTSLIEPPRTLRVGVRIGF